MNKASIVIIGGGPAGLSAAIEGAKAGAKVLVIDENGKPGGQLFKQIHKFFGSKEHKAGTRGINIGDQLLEEAKRLDIEVWLNTEVCGIDKNKKIWGIRDKKQSFSIVADKIILATGAIENAVKFSGWTLPGVMGAGAAQTMINLNRTLPGKKILMLGSGNVGVIVSYQLMQAGAEVVGIVEAAPRLGGYGVHTAKVRRAGVNFYTSHTISRAIGENCVEAVEIVQLDSNWKPIEGTEKILEVDTICIAAGLTPLTELAWIAGSKFVYIQEMGGHVPAHNKTMETTVEGIYVAGDVSGIEEASTAMEEGRLAGINAAASLGFYIEKEQEERTKIVWNGLNALRCGPFGHKRKNAKDKILASREG
ncbi:NAD(P)/FAD-dependent oxidoreductase [Marinisporobacter balticus]|uniref:Thioredoxin reductase n=1 Tax=Marinisporobacter balticus TaxID=2018667 RepID=A0A4R2KD05_9FIRM|nr:NAD(P)/FAD-dependent oxidoreductase [Marinisporobacter balticus]TCO71461.1 thioredoxin reductase [Marinisporobacter balticus]